MAQIAISTRQAASYIGLEAVSFGTLAASMIRMFPASGTVDVGGIDQSIIDVPDERTRGFKYVVPVLGLKSVNAQIKLDAHLRPDGTQLDGTNTVPVTPPWLDVLMKGGFGGATDASFPQTTGTPVGAVLSGTPGTGTSISVTAGQGARFVQGEWIAIQTSIGLETARVCAIATDTLTISPAVTGTPVATTGKVIALRTFGLDQFSTQSLSFQHAKVGDSNSQWQALGCMVDGMEFSFERNQLPKATFSMKAASWTGPSAQSFSTAAAADTMVTPIGTRNALVLLQGSAITTKSQYIVQSFNVKLNLGMTQINDINSGQTSGLEGVSSVLRIPQRPVGTVELSVLHDVSRMTDFTSQNKLQAVFIWQVGSGTSARFIVADCPTIIPNKAPSYKEQNGYGVTTISAALMEDESTTNATTNLALSPFRLAYG